MRISLILSLIFLAACERLTSSGVSTRVTFQSGELGSQSAIPEGKKACYGVHAFGTGLPKSSVGSCGFEVGKAVGFVAEGGTLVLDDVPKGSQTFELFIYLVGSTESCPSFSSSMLEKISDVGRLYRSGRTDANIVGDNENVTISVSFPGEAQTLLAENASTASCMISSMTKATLFSNGDILDKLGNVSSSSDETNESFSVTSLGNGIVSTGAMFGLLGASPIALPEEIFSVSMKPDSGNFYGLLHSGQIVQVNKDSGTYTELAASSCPFDVTNCAVPEWMQSISAGLGKELYGLDHGGNVYLIKQSDVVSMGVAFPENVTQISFY